VTLEQSTRSNATVNTQLSFLSVTRTPTLSLSLSLSLSVDSLPHKLKVFSKSNGEQATPYGGDTIYYLFPLFLFLLKRQSGLSLLFARSKASRQPESTGRYVLNARCDKETTRQGGGGGDGWMRLGWSREIGKAEGFSFLRRFRPIRELAQFPSTLFICAFIE